jgi:hypothetical protein
MVRNRTQLLLRIAIAFVFLYAAIAGLINPSAWVGFIPLWIEKFASIETLLFGWSLFEIFLGVSLLAFPRSAWPAGIATLALLGLTLSNLGAFDILFRDIGLVLASAALFLEQRER